MLQAQQVEVDNVKQLMDDILNDLSVYFGDVKSITVKVDKNLATGAKAGILKHEIKVGTEVLQLNKEQLKGVIAHELSHGWILHSKFAWRWISYMFLALLYLASVLLSITVVFLAIFIIPMYIALIALVFLNIASRLAARLICDVEYQCDKDATLAIKSTALADSLESYVKLYAIEYVENRMSPWKKLIISIQDLIQAFFGYLHPPTFVRIEKIKKIQY